MFSIIYIISVFIIKNEIQSKDTNFAHTRIRIFYIAIFVVCDAVYFYDNLILLPATCRLLWKKSETRARIHIQCLCECLINIIINIILLLSLTYYKTQYSTFFLTLSASFILVFNIVEHFVGIHVLRFCIRSHHANHVSK